MERNRIIGLLLIVLGILFGIRSMGWFPLDLERVLFRRELLLMGIGAFALLVEQKTSIGISLLLIGLIFWIPSAFQLSLDINPWPVLLIALGGFLFFGSRYGKKAPSKPDKPDAKRFHESVIFGNSERIFTGPEYEGGEVTSLFGETRIDLTRSNWSESGNAIHLFIAFGSCTLHIPSDWELEVEINSIFGHFKDLRNRSGTEGSQEAPRIRIHGICLFGDGKVRE